MKRSFRALMIAFVVLLVSAGARANHFYTTSPTGELAPQAGYKSDGQVAFVYSQPGPDRVPMYRWYNPKRNAHFYTTHGEGEHAPGMGYQAEGVAFYCSSKEGPGLLPFQRWQHEKNIKHFYTTDPKGELAPSFGYKAEGVMCYVNARQDAGTTPLFRWFYGGGKSAGTAGRCQWVCNNDPAVGKQCQTICRGG